MPGIAESRITDVSAVPSGCGIALNDNGTIWLWGSVSYNDPLGLQPVIMPGMDHVVAISGDIFPVVLKDDGTVWLIRTYPAFENASLLAKMPEQEPVKVPGLDNIVAISGSSGNLLMLSRNGTVWAMGGNWFGQLGPAAHYGDADQFSLNVVQVTGLLDIKGIAMGGGHALALKNDGTVWSWGLNDFGQRGDGTYIRMPNGNDDGNPVPGMVTGLSGVAAVAAGDEFSLALKNDGTVWSWGRNSFGQLGDWVPGNVEDNRTTPVQVKGLTNVTSISAGQWYALALRDDGTVWSWGDNRNYGMLGDGTLEPRNLPVRVKELAGITSISAGIANSFALDKYGVIWAWGDDGAGQLGDLKQGTQGAQGMWNIYRATPGKVPFSEALAGPEISPAWMGSSRPSVQVTAPAPEPSIEYMAAADGSIYAFGNNRLTVMDDKGVKKWDMSIPGSWTYESAYSIIVNAQAKGTRENYDAPTDTLTKADVYSMVLQKVKMVPTFAAENGHTYLYVLADASDNSYDPLEGMSSLPHPVKPVEKELLAVGPDGKMEWSHSFVDDVAVQDRSHVEAHGSRIYLYHGYNESVFDASGKLLFTIENIADPVSVDESGYAYALPATGMILPSRPMAADGGYYDYRIPSGTVVKYGLDGAVVWRKDIGQNISQPYFMPAVWNDEIGLPLYKDDRLYVPVEHGIVALDKDGAPIWKKTYDDAYRLFYLMPMDSKGNVYIFNQHEYPRYNDSNSTIIAIRPDGRELGRADVGAAAIVRASDGMFYGDGRTTDQIMAASGATAASLGKIIVSAYDMNEGKYAWSFTTPVGDARTVTINESNVLTLFPDYLKNGDPAGGFGDDHARAQVIPAGNLTYIYFKTAAWDTPVVYDKSTYTYFSALYAVDKTGRLVWQKPMSSFVTAAVANNSTIYYGTNGGGISVETIGVVAGLAIAGSLLLFFVLGSVTRARSKIDKNDNRNRIYKFIADQPGSTLYEMSKALGMNIGTLRYHLMILGLNHRIVTYNDDSKFVRYFANSNTYDNEDKMIISLLRRGSMGKLLKAILESGEITNGELCVRLGLPESGISKYLSELSDKGVVTKTGQGTRMYYSIRELHRDRLAKAIAMVDNSTMTALADT